jgi:hypothetical protein
MHLIAGILCFWPRLSIVTVHKCPVQGIHKNIKLTSHNGDSGSKKFKRGYGSTQRKLIPNNFNESCYASKVTTNLVWYA